MSKSIAAVVSKMVGDLASLKDDEERERAFAGSRAVLGMTSSMNAPPDTDSQTHEQPPGAQGAKVDGISGAGSAWLRRRGLSKESIDEYFHIEEGKVKLTGDAIGSGKRQQTINTYLLSGVVALLESGKPDFTDDMARENCKNLGCYDAANHSMTLTQFGNQITGSKKTGWKLTAPGLNAAAALLKPKQQENK